MQTLKERYEKDKFYEMLHEALDLKELEKVDKIIDKLKKIQKMPGLSGELNSTITGYIDGLSNLDSALDSGMNPLKWFKKTHGRDTIASAVHFLSSFEDGMKSLEKFLKVTLKIDIFGADVSARLKLSTLAADSFTGGIEKFKTLLTDLFDKKAEGDFETKLKKFFTGGRAVGNIGKWIADSLMGMTVGDIIKLITSMSDNTISSALKAAGEAIIATDSPGGAGGQPGAGGGAQRNNNAPAKTGGGKGGAAAKRQDTTPGRAKISPESPLAIALADQITSSLRSGKTVTKAIINWLAQQGKLTEALENGMIKLVVDQKALRELLK